MGNSRNKKFGGRTIIPQKEFTNYVMRAGKKCHTSYRRELTAELQNSLSDFIEDTPNHTMADVLEHFGSPEKFADEYLLTMDETERRTVLHKARWIRKAVSAGMAIAILIIAVVVGWIVHDNSQSVAFIMKKYIKQNNSMLIGTWDVYTI